MASTEIESYRQLEQEYAQAQAEYQKAEEAYSRGDVQPALAVQVYEDLTAKRENLESLYASLREMRTGLAQLREEASRKVVL